MSKEKVTMAMMKRAEQVSNGATLLMEKTKDWQVIKQYLCNRLSEMKLTEKQEEKLKRYQYIYNQLVSGKYTENEVVSQLTRQPYNISIIQAYEDLTSTRELFSFVINVNKRFELQLQLQINRKMLYKAEELNDMKSYAALEKNRAALLKEIPEAPDNPADLFEGHSFEAVFDPTLLGAAPVDMKAVLKDINAKRGKKIEIDMFTEDIPFENVPNDKETSL